MSSPPSHLAQPESLTSLILQTWCTSTLLPLSLPLPPNPSHSLLAALLNLANLTPNQPERAWNLLSTYFHARIREASYTGRGSGGLYAVLAEEDVLKACGSVRRMSVGIDMEVGVKREETSNSATGHGSGKRKWSIRDEIVEDNEGEAGMAKMQDVKDEEENELPPLPAILDMPPRPESRVELPPIYTLQGRKEYRVELETLVEAARGAVEERNSCRRELEDAEDAVRVARGKYTEARRLAERLRAEVRRVEGETMGSRQLR